MSETSRRALLTSAAGVAAAALAGCQVYGTESGGTTQGSGQQAGGGGADAGASADLAKVADIPVGGGKVFEDQGIVVTQPEAGTIKAFSATCTHQGCTVASVSNGTINCPCHGSKFKVADGSVANGPAAAPLSPVRVTVEGGSIKLT
ncbi:MAG TPA: Rieske (2Fe-2S) protein [Micromonosporaceae bacterium]|nr:Rieske (2Fe-2S) protein [Micromonosporaceae bacterium]